MKSQITVPAEVMLSVYPWDLILNEVGEILSAGHHWEQLNVIGKPFELFLSEYAAVNKDVEISPLTAGFDETKDYRISDSNIELFRINEVIYVKWPAKYTLESLSNNRKYQQLFENNMAAVFRTSLKGDILEINQAYADIFGFDSVEELKTHKSSEFYPDAKSRLSYIQTLRAQGSLKNYIVKNINRFGDEIFLIANVRISIEDNEECIEGTLIDITHQIRSEERIAEQNKELTKLSSILENISDAVQVVDETGKIVYLNAEAKTRLGVDNIENGELSITDFSPFFKSTVEFSEHMDHLEKNSPLVIESQHINQKTKEIYNTELNVKFEIINSEKYIIATGRDISERLESQKALRERDKHIQDLNDAIDSSSLVSVTDEKGYILDVNDKFCEVSQYSREELIGENHRIVSSKTHTHLFWKEFYGVITKGELWVGEICNRKKDGSLYWVRTVIYPIINENEKPVRFMSIRQEITGEKEAERIIRKHLNFQNLLVNIALKLINVEPNVLDEVVNSALEDIGLFVGADRAYIFDYNLEEQSSSNLFEWCRDGIEPQISNLQNVPLKDMPDWPNRHFNGEIMDIPDVAALPDSILKRLLEEQDIQSLLALPLLDGDNCTGFIGFDSVRTIHPFNDNDKKILELFALMLVNIYKRVESMRLIDEANQHILNTNKNLEKRIQEEMDKTSQMTQSIATIDKMAMIGELTSGLAHDLNTPLGAIKVGAESVRYTLENLFKRVLEANSTEQLHFACSRAVKTNFDMFVGGIQSMKESRDLSIYLTEHYGDLQNKEALIQLFVKARVTIDEPEVINKVMSYSDPSAFLDLIYHIQSIRTFIDTIMEASEKAGAVIKSLRFYLKEGAAQENVQIDLKENIMTVVNVFNHMIKEYNIDLQLSLEEDLVLNGFTNRLYQLWSNLLKNAIEATGEHGHISISSKRTDNGIEVSLSNTGEPIPQDIQDKIWKKFFTTKTTQGTGLGLSIVKRVAEEHGAKIQLHSGNEGTTFSITFEPN